MANSRPILLLYCQHSVGIGHLRRSIAIAEPLTQRFRVVFLNGGRFPDAIPQPKTIKFIDLPPLGMDADGKLIARNNGQSLAEAKKLRRKMIMEIYLRLRPEVLLIELFPFGRKKFAFELLPLLRAAQRSAPKPLVVCSLRDILVDGRDDQQHFDNRARWLTDRYFDAVLVHTDAKFAQLDESFRPLRPLKTPVYHTGFVVADSNDNTRRTGVADFGVVVSAGGGIVGTRLLHAAVEAQPWILRELGIPMTIVAGPFLPEMDWLSLTRFARNRPGLTLYRSVPNLKKLMQNATVSVSQCCYNTVMDLLQAQVPALVIPYSTGQENEQSKRAEKLAQLGIVRVLAEAELNPDKLTQEIKTLCSLAKKSHRLDLDGCEQTRTTIVRLVDELRMKSGGQCGKVA